MSDFKVENKIEFVGAEAKSENTVTATYSLEGTEFSVEWSNIHPGTGEVFDSFDLTDGHGSVTSDNKDLKIFIEEELAKGEDSDIYLLVRDTFDAGMAKELADELIEPEAIARNIEDFDFEAGSAGGLGKYTADIRVGADKFSVDLYYEYYYNDNRGFGALPAWMLGESDGAELGNEEAIEMAADMAGVELDGDAVRQIVSDLEGQVDNYVEENYSASVEAIQTAFEERQKERQAEREQEYDGMSM